MVSAFSTLKCPLPTKLFMAPPSNPFCHKQYNPRPLHEHPEALPLSIKLSMTQLSNTFRHRQHHRLSVNSPPSSSRCHPLTNSVANCTIICHSRHFTFFSAHHVGHSTTSEPVLPQTTQPSFYERFKNSSPRSNYSRHNHLTSSANDDTINHLSVTALIFTPGLSNCSWYCCVNAHINVTFFAGPAKRWLHNVTLKNTV